MKRPLADVLRPLDLENVVGQKHLLAEDKILYKVLSTGNIPNMIFYGPSGTGKTTVANIAARVSDKQLYKLNATNASVSDIKSIVGELETFSNRNGVILYLDEIQNFNKKQQQSLLEYIENGQITLIASTTENPYFYIYNAILSRSTVFEFLPVSPEDIIKALERAVDFLKKEYHPTKLSVSNDAILHIANTSNGDVRKAINALEIAVLSESLGEEINIILDIATEATQKKALRYDKDGDSHYDILSAFQKSIRGSDPDAAVHYLARLIEAGDLPSICRRLLVIAAEDIGLSYPNAITIVKACVDSAYLLGLPEARIPLAQGTLFLATCPKSNSAITAIDSAINDIRTIDTGDIPLFLKDAHYEGAIKMGRGVEYKNPHNFPNNYVKQNYLPSFIKDKKYYTPGNNKFEQNTKKYWDSLKN